MARLLALIFLLAAAAASPAAAAGRFLWVSDIHFDPMADPGLVNRLNAAPAQRWPAILDSSPDKSLGRYGRDTNWRLLSSSFAAMKAALPHPDFILFTGDFLAHDFRGAFDAIAQNHSDLAYRAFVLKTMELVASQFESAFPKTPVIPVLGNNDSYCGDYRITPHGAFLKDSLPILRRLLGGARPRALAADWDSEGNYRLTPARLPRVRVIALDTVFFSPDYRNACGGKAGGDPAAATLAWLGRALAAAQRAHRRVWLVYHIPPGMDAYASARFGSCPGRLVAMWKSADQASFDGLMRRYAGLVAANFAGHTHTDETRLIDRDGFVLISPAVSPIFGQNPAFRVVSYDASGQIIDATTYDLPALSPAARWRAEYRFTQEWRAPRIDLASLAALYRHIGASPRARARWLRLYAVSRASFWPKAAGPRRARQRAAYCAAGHLSAAGFGKCYCIAGGG